MKHVSLSNSCAFSLSVCYNDSLKQKFVENVDGLGQCAQESGVAKESGAGNAFNRNVDMMMNFLGFCSRQAENSTVIPY